MDNKDNQFETRCIHGSKSCYDTTGAVSLPIFQTATFAHKGFGESTGFDYSRLQNPTREYLEETVAGLEEGIDGIAFSTGMAAISAIMELFKPGDHIIASEDLYGGSHRLFHHISMKNGVFFDFVNTSRLEDIKEKINFKTKGIFVETPTNPMMHVTDIKGVAEIAKGNNLYFIVDNTFLTPYYQKPLVLGADIVVHSGTKFLGGHNDTLAGFVVVKSRTLSEKLRFIAKTTGASLAPFDSWLIHRGIKTLPIRMERQQKNALQMAQWLKEQNWVKQVFYVGLKEHENYALSCSQSTGFGSMISFEVQDFEMVKRLLKNIKLIMYAESLGGVETLITYPMTQTHGDIPETERLAKGINDSLLRLSVGLEDVFDLIRDLEQAANKDIKTNYKQGHKPLI